MVNPGWYPDPDDATARRYWDGKSWSAPLLAAPATPPSAGSSSNPYFVPCGDCGEQSLYSLPHCAKHVTPADREALAKTGEAARDRLARIKSKDPKVRRAALEEARSMTSAGQEPLQPLAPTSSESGDAVLVCPHCQTRGQVKSKRSKQKKGVSGGKATGAVLTAGVSLLATGLSRKQYVTEMTCGNCRTTWQV